MKDIFNEKWVYHVVSFQDKSNDRGLHRPSFSYCEVMYRVLNFDCLVVSVQQLSRQT